MAKYVVVEAIQTYRMVYVMEANTNEKVEDMVHANDAVEFGQFWLGEMVVSSRRCKGSEVVRLYDELNPGLDLTREEILMRVPRV